MNLICIYRTLETRLTEAIKKKDWDLVKNLLLEIKKEIGEEVK